MINAIQAAVYAQLTAEVSLAEIFDFMPREEDYPCVIIGDEEPNENDTDTENGFDSVITIHTWVSDDINRGYKVLNAIMEQVYGALHWQTLTAAGYGISGIYQESSNKVRDADGITRHGIQRFRIFYEKIGV